MATGDALPSQSWLVGFLILSGLLAVAACSSGGATGGTPGTGGGGGGTGGSSGIGGGPAATGGAVGTGGAAPGTGGSASGGGGTGAGGTSGGGGTTGAGGGTSNCAGRAVSLSANGTSTDSDTAHARVVVDLLTDLPIGNAARTVEFWAFIKTSDWVGERNELFAYGTAGTTTSFGLDFGTNPVLGMAGNHATLDPFTNGGFSDDSTNYLGITSTTDQWVHIAMTWNGVVLQTYVNGALGITTTGTGGTTMLATARTALTIGCNEQNMFCFNGTFDEFRVWKVARTAVQIHDNYNRAVAGSDPDLVGYWKFDDAPGSTTAADSVTAPHTPHAGTLMALAPAMRPTFVTPTPPVPLLCP